jgi:hypothetical protein
MIQQLSSQIDYPVCRPRLAQALSNQSQAFPLRPRSGIGPVQQRPKCGHKLRGHSMFLQHLRHDFPAGHQVD